MYRSYFTYYTIIFSIALLFSCSAPRNNPLDPENSENKIGTIEGYIQTVSVPHSPIANTKIFWSNDGIVTESNSNGAFSISGIERNDGWLILEHQNYTIDSVYIDFNGENKISRTFFLNSIPKINVFNFYSITLNKYPSKQDYNLEAEVRITDEENDIDSVFIKNEELGTRVNLLYNATSKNYERSINLSDLNLTLSIDAVIGKNFDINVVDAENKNFDIGTSNIKRIIKEEIETTSPSGRDSVETGNPTLAWRKFTPGFNFNYLIEIYTDELPAILLWQQEVNSDAIDLQSSANLDAGEYFWVIWGIDEFGNRTRSKPASFIVK